MIYPFFGVHFFSWDMCIHDISLSVFRLIKSAPLFSVVAQGAPIYLYLQDIFFIVIQLVFSRYSAPIFCLVHCHMTSNDETVFR